MPPEVFIEGLMQIPTPNGVEVISTMRRTLDETGSKQKEIDHVLVHDGVVTGAYRTTSSAGARQKFARLSSFIGARAEFIPASEGPTGQRSDFTLRLTPPTTA